MAHLDSAPLERSSPSSGEDLARVAAGRLRRALGTRHDGAILADFLEEDVRAALKGLDTLRAHLEDVLRALLAERPVPLELLEAGDDSYAQAALLDLEAALASLRRRMAQAAARVASAGRSQPSDAEGAERKTCAAAEDEHPHRV